MKYVIIRDDDTNALMPVEYLERLYRPFIQRNLPVNLAVIPNVSTKASYAPGRLEKFLLAYHGDGNGCVPIGTNAELLRYLRCFPQYNFVQHGSRHEFVGDHYEFDHEDRAEIAKRLDEGIQFFEQAGLPRPRGFVAPYDQLSRVSMEEVAKRFEVVSTGWFEMGRIPPSWWPKYALKKMRHAPHWRVGSTTLLSHPGCHLSYHRSYSLMLQEIERSIERRRLTVLVTHWWEYFRDGRPDDAFIDVLHRTADYLASRKDLKVVSFNDVADRKVALN
jgi:hypothetical protein